MLQHLATEATGAGGPSRRGLVLEQDDIAGRIPQDIVGDCTSTGRQRAVSLRLDVGMQAGHPHKDERMQAGPHPPTPLTHRTPRPAAP